MSILSAVEIANLCKLELFSFCIDTEEFFLF